GLAGVADLHDEVDRYLAEHGDRKVVDWGGVISGLQHDFALRLAGAEERFALSLVERYAGRQWIAVDAAEVTEENVQHHRLVVPVAARHFDVNSGGAARS